jgi:hypothetical protein
MGRGMGLAKCRILGEGTGAEDGDALPGRVSMHAVERGVAVCHDRSQRSLQCWVVISLSAFSSYAPGRPRAGGLSL